MATAWSITGYIPNPRRTTVTDCVVLLPSLHNNEFYTLFRFSTAVYS